MKFILPFLLSLLTCQAAYFPAQQSSWYGSAAAAPFTPLSMTSGVMVAWYRADTTNGTSTWSDKSIHAYDLVMTSGAAQPYSTNSTRFINNQPWMQFAGAQWLTNGMAVQVGGTNVWWAQLLTFYAVMKFENLGANINFFDSFKAWAVSSNRVAMQTYTSSNIIVNAGGGNSTSAMLYTNWYLLKIVVNGGATSYATNGVFNGTSGTGGNALQGITLGANYSGSTPLKGGIADLLIVQGTISAADNFNITSNYFQRIYGSSTNTGGWF